MDDPSSTAEARLTNVAPVLLVRNVVASAEYWRDCVGFAFDRYWGKPADFVMVGRDGLTVFLSQAPAGASLTPHWRIKHQMWNTYFWVDDARALYAELQRRGARIDYTLHEKPYGCLEFGIQDLDDHDIAFGQKLD
ncbi:MAG: VOC family protein [Planctomycetota bacterium]